MAAQLDNTTKNGGQQPLSPSPRSEQEEGLRVNKEALHE